MFSKAWVGDRVWEMANGWGTIFSTNGDVPCRPIVVRFDNGHNYCFTINGKVSINATYPTLFWNEIKFEIPKPPKRKVKKWIAIMQNDKKEVRVVISLNKWDSIGNLPVLFDTEQQAMNSNSNVFKTIEIEIEEK